MKAARVNASTLFSYDEDIRSSYPVVAGIDEAGRGPLAGPVVAAAVILPQGAAIEGLKDSKLLSEDKRIKLFREIVCIAENIGIGIVDADVIDKINILKSTRLAMERAVKELLRLPDILLIDAVSLPDVKVLQRSMIRGESVSASIAAASIIAKTARDDIMMAYDKEYPHYNFRQHKGYPTKEHMELIRLHGPCLIHRKTFRPVMNAGLKLFNSEFPCMFYKVTADIVVLVHFLWIMFLMSGAFLGRRYYPVKILHIGGIGFAALIQIAGWYCPLTYLEIWLREMHDPSESYAGSFIINYMQRILYIEISREIIFLATIVLIVVSARVYLYHPYNKHSAADKPVSRTGRHRR
ncbi:MAG: ribonuclease HII [Nitrospirae bacterium]|nr:ribonuclease HII [Nitrospirota bacterium]